LRLEALFGKIHDSTCKGSLLFWANAHSLLSFAELFSVFCSSFLIKRVRKRWFSGWFTRKKENSFYGLHHQRLVREELHLHQGFFYEEKKKFVRCCGSLWRRERGVLHEKLMNYKNRVVFWREKTLTIFRLKKKESGNLAFQICKFEGNNFASNWYFPG